MLSHCTLAVTVALPVSVKVQVFVLFPPLEQAPDHTTSRPFVALSVIAVLEGKDAEPLLPTVTLIPVGLEVIRSPLRPVAVTVSVAVWAGGVTVRAAVRVTPPALAVIVADVDVVTVLVVIAKVAMVAPAATVTFVGTAPAVLLLVSATANPPDGAAAVRVMIPCEAVPPVTLVGSTATADSAEGGVGGVTVSVALRVTPPYVPLMVTDVDAVTLDVPIGKVAPVAPAGTVTPAGTVAAAVTLLARKTAAPPLGAAEVRVIVPVEEVPPVTLVGLTVTALAAGAGAAVGFTVSTAPLARPP